MPRYSRRVKNKLIALRSSNCDTASDSDSDFLNNDNYCNSDDNYNPSEETDIEDSESGESDGDEDEDEENNDNTDTNDNNLILDSNNDNSICSLKSKDNTIWSLNPISQNVGRRSSANVIRHIPGPAPIVNSLTDTTAWSFLNLFLDNNLIDKICTYTNKYANDNNLDLKLTPDLFKKYLGLVIARSHLVANHVDTHLLWSKNFGLELFKSTMSRNMFVLINRCLRLDDKATRNERIVRDGNFAAANEYFFSLINNFQRYYKPSAYLTIDESLAGCKARCKFIQYISSKSDKFGIKFYLLVDRTNNYVLNGVPYTGKDTNRPSDEPYGEYIVKKLIDPYENLGLNVCADNFFTTKKLGDYLLTKKTTLLGTVRQNKTFIPDVLKKQMARFDSKIVYSNNCSLTAYQSKAKKKVYLYSTLHDKEVKVESIGKKLPETVRDYNDNKYGVDIFDKRRKSKSTKQSSNRWVMYVFYYGIDMSIINSYELYKKVVDPNLGSFKFALQLIENLTGFKINSPDKNYDEQVIIENRNDLVLDKRKRCAVKTDCNDNKTKRICIDCNRPVCGNCSELICTNCLYKKSV